MTHTNCHCREFIGKYRSTEALPFAAKILDVFLRVTQREMLASFKSEFVILVEVIKDQVVPKLKKADSHCCQQLEPCIKSFLEEYKKPHPNFKTLAVSGDATRIVSHDS